MKEKTKRPPFDVARFFAGIFQSNWLKYLLWVAFVSLVSFLIINSADKENIYQGEDITIAGNEANNATRFTIDGSAQMWASSSHYFEIKCSNAILRSSYVESSLNYEIEPSQIFAGSCEAIAIGSHINLRFVSEEILTVTFPQINSYIGDVISIAFLLVVIPGVALLLSRLGI